MFQNRKTLKLSDQSSSIEKWSMGVVLQKVKKKINMDKKTSIKDILEMKEQETWNVGG